MGGGVVDKGREDPNITECGPSSARQCNVIIGPLNGVSLAGSMMAWAW